MEWVLEWTSKNFLSLSVVSIAFTVVVASLVLYPILDHFRRIKTNTSLYERIGGENALDSLVEMFYKKVLDNDHVKGFFDGVDMNKQKLKQKQFLSSALGASTTYTGRSLDIAHRKLVENQGLKNEHFDTIVKLMHESLKELNLDDSVVNEILLILESTRNKVLSVKY